MSLFDMIPRIWCTRFIPCFHRNDTHTVRPNVSFVESLIPGNLTLFFDSPAGPSNPKAATYQRNETYQTTHDLVPYTFRNG